MCSINVFMPEKIKSFESGFLSGRYFAGDYDCGVEPAILAIDDEIKEEESNNSVGVIMNRMHTRGQRKSPWIVLETKPSFSILSMIIDGQPIDFGNVNVVFYNASEIKNSYLLDNYETCSDPLSKNLDCFIKRVKGVKKTKCKTNSISSTSIFTKYISIICLMVSSFLNLCLKNVEFFFKKLDSKSYCIEQLLHRINQIRKFRRSQNKREDLIAIRVIGIILVDIFFGILSFYVFYNWTSALELNRLFRSSTNVIAGNVERLLSWLRGAPAGLKLNQPLAESLASFFSYHVYLWRLYLEAGNPVLVIVTQAFIFMAPFGISIQIGLLADFLNLAVLHVHCFYIYAARLHMVLVSLLGSQWRAFRGRKWNPLKERVDTLPEMRQRPLVKVMSAVGFTLVVFLLPTTTVYYAVFVMLRLCKMALLGIVSMILWMLNFNPVLVACLHILGSPLLKGQVHFELDHRSIENARGPVELRLTIRPSPFKEAVASSHSGDIFPLLPKPDLGQIWKSLIYAKDLL